ncbi:MAG: porin family protein [Paracoccus sp. (in: a-proteobacteria)]|nr:porin family protein [Paracoccus sp. (in: a-proteobacteria)]
MKLAIATVVASMIAGSAIAGGYVAPVEPTQPIIVAPVVDTVSNWTGFYAGLQYGAGELKFKQDGTTDKFDADGWGLHAGYMHDFGQFVLGGELDYNKLGVDDFDNKAELTRLRARAGYDAGRFLPYATLGVAKLSLDGTPNGVADISETGVTYGIGADFKVTERFVVGAEYSVQNFDDVADISGLDVDTNLLQLRASYRF